jgi:hypothetical protein
LANSGQSKSTDYLLPLIGDGMQVSLSKIRYFDAPTHAHLHYSAAATTCTRTRQSLLASTCIERIDLVAAVLPS